MTNRDSLGTRNLIEPGGLHRTAAGAVWSTKRCLP
jgi:redox-sensitive bicupin YhaK (pirin superfamily)